MHDPLDSAYAETTRASSGETQKAPKFRLEGEHNDRRDSKVRRFRAKVARLSIQAPVGLPCGRSMFAAQWKGDRLFGPVIHEC